MKEALVIFAKAPLAGQVKTRLIGMLTAEEAAALYVCFLRDTFALMEAVQEERETLSLVLCYTPATELEAFEAAEIDGCLMLAQRGNNLGERLQNCLVDLFELGFAAVVIIGADSPSLPAEFLSEAFERLQIPVQVVIGPAKDGGFYLAGMNAPHTSLFDHLAWDTEDTFSQIQQRAVEMNTKLSLLPEWYDIDTIADLQQLQAEIADGKAELKATSRYLKKLHQ